MDYKKILLIRLSSAGDIVLTFPAYFFLLNNLPNAKIDWIVDKKFELLLNLLPNINKKIIFDSKLIKTSFFNVSTLKYCINLIKELKDAQYDLVIDFQGLFKSGIISFLSNAKVRAAFFPVGHDSREFNHIFNNKIIKVDSSYEYNLKLVYRSIYLAASAIDVSPPKTFEIKKYVENLPTNDNIQYFLNEVNSKKRLHNSLLILINPFTNWQTKTLPINTWKELIKLSRNHEKLKNVIFLVLWGPNEKEKALEIAKDDELTYITPLTNLSEVFSIIDNCDILISGDSFALHAGFILNKPIVSIFGASDPNRCAPFGNKSKIVSLSLPCQYCFKKVCPLKHNDCIEKITADMIILKLIEIINECKL